MPPQDAQVGIDHERTRTADGAPPVVDSYAETRDHQPASGHRVEVSTDRGDATPTPTDFKLPPRYAFVRRLGRGGMGEVVHAFDNDLQRHVAIKFMRPTAATSAFARRRFLDEARILAQLHHENVVDVYEKGEVDGEPYFVMAYLDGYSLAERREEFRTSAGRAVGVMIPVANGVQHAHDNGVFHRDLKGSNVMFDDGRPVVVDFGCARWDDAELSTQRFAILGTPSHLAPEVWEQGSKAHDARADLWSLGVMLYHLLAGELPFTFDTLTPDGRARLKTEDPAAIRSHASAAPGVDDRLEAIVRKALAKNPDERYQTAAELARELAGWQETAVTPLPAVPPPTPAPRRTRRLALVGLATAALALVVVAVALVWSQPSPPPPPAAELWANGQSVVLVDSTGRFREPADKMTGFVGGFETVADERAASLSSGGVLLVVFDTPWLGRSFRLRADVHHLAENAGSEVGLAVAHRHLGGSKHAVFTNTFRGASVPPGQARQSLAQAYAGGRCVTLSDVKYPLNDYSTPLATIGVVEHPHAPAGTAREFRRLTVTCTENDVTAEHDGVVVSRIDWRTLTNRALGKFFHEQRAAPNPLYGTGIGLIVRNGTGLFRNVTVEPLPPNP